VPTLAAALSRASSTLLQRARQVSTANGRNDIHAAANMRYSLAGVSSLCLHHGSWIEVGLGGF